jgi:Na+/H+ antiporter NhaD/arsenite permease-like protein
MERNALVDYPSPKRKMRAARLLERTVGIELGSRLLVTASLSTKLCPIELRREKIDVSAWRFLCVGVIVMLPALILAVESTLVHDALRGSAADLRTPRDADAKTLR